MSSSTTEWHAHWDCSRGATGSSLLSACYEAWRKLKEQTDNDHGGDDTTTDPKNGVNGFPSILREILPSRVASQCSIVQDSGIRIVWGTSDNRAPTLTLVHAKEILEQTKSLPRSVQDQALKILQYMEEALNQTLSANTDHVLLDEGMDVLVYTVGTLWLLNDLHVSSISVRPVPCNGGTPLETLHLLIGSAVSTDSQGLVTPLAAAILKTVTSKSPKPSSFTLRTVGVAALLGSTQNTVRLIVGTTTPEATPDEQHVQEQPKQLWKTDHLIHMEANLDDISAEALAFAVELLLKNGAVDAWVTPIVMKKGRAAHTLHCLCRQDASRTDREASTLWERLLKLIFEHTTTLGVRIHRNLERVALRRSFVTVQTPYVHSKRKGLVDVKLGYLGGGDNSQAVSVKAEFDHCREISLETGIPIQQIAAFAVQEAWKKTVPADEHQAL